MTQFVRTNRRKRDHGLVATDPSGRVQYADYPAEAYFEILILDGQYLADSKRRP
jgi:hypothetical protein